MQLFNILWYQLVHPPSYFYVPFIKCIKKQNSKILFIFNSNRKAIQFYSLATFLNIYSA